MLHNLSALPRTATMRALSVMALQHVLHSDFVACVLHVQSTAKQGALEAPRLEREMRLSMRELPRSRKAKPAAKHRHSRVSGLGRSSLPRSGRGRRSSRAPGVPRPSSPIWGLPKGCPSFGGAIIASLHRESSVAAKYRKYASTL